ncbi:MAG: MopE-related protein [bacterium]
MTSSRGAVHLLTLADGIPVWQSPYLGALTPITFVGEFDDDPLPELYIAGRSSLSLFLDFTGDAGARIAPDNLRTWRTHDDADNPERNTVDYSEGRNAAVLDLDGDGIDEVVWPGDRRVYVYRGSDGRKMRPPAEGSAVDYGHPLAIPVPEGCPFSVRYGSARSSVFANPDGTEAVLYSLDAAGYGRHLFTLHWAPTPLEGEDRGRLQVRRYWRVANGALVRHDRIDDALADLDGDGRFEIITGDGAGVADEGGIIRARTHRVFVLGASPDPVLGLPPWQDACDARDHDRAILGTIDAARAQGIWRHAHDALDPRPIVLVDEAGALVGYRFERTDDLADDASPTPDRVTFQPREGFRLAGHTVVLHYDSTGTPDSSARLRPLALPLADGRRALLTRDGNAITLHAITPDGGAIEVIGRYTPPAGVRLWAFVPHPSVAGAPGIAALRTDGGLTLLDHRLTPVVTPGLGDAPIRIRRLPGATGRYRMPLAASFERDEPANLIVHLAGGVLARLDARAATRVQPPVVHWTWPGAYHPTLWDLDRDLIPEIIAYHGDSIEARDADLDPRFRTHLAHDGQRPFRAPVPGRDPRDNNGVRLHALVQDDNHGTAGIATLGSEGGIDWRSPWYAVATQNTGIPTPDDPDGDGIDLVLVGFSSALRILDAFTGATLRSTLDNYPEYIVNVRRPGREVTHLISAGINSLRAVAIEGDPPAVREIYRLELDTEENGLSVLDCPDGRTVAIGTRDSTHRLHRFDVADGDHHHTLHLAAGRSWPDDDAVPLEHRGALLGPTSGIAALHADQPAVVVGSTDGHLYAVDPCPEGPPRLLWSLDLGAAVGPPIFADTDGDNAVEIVVAPADGMLHGIDTLRTPPPEWIHDLDDPNGAADLDETNRPHLETLHAAWAPVPGAVAYEYTFLDANGPCGPFMPAQGTRAVSNCPLVPGARYAVAARAIGPLGTSPEAISDGIRWLPCPDADGDGHCADDDCDDADPAIPAPAEQCAAQGMPDGIDDDCDGLVDEGCPCLDGPAPEEPNGADDDCDGAIDEGCVEERANGIDDDCDTLIDEGFTCGPEDTDDDEDGVCALFDCDDRDPTRAPGLEDTCHDGRDQDCDGRADEGCPCLDTDEDGACDPDDCRPEDPTIHPPPTSSATAASTTTATAAPTKAAAAPPPPAMAATVPSAPPPTPGARRPRPRLLLALTRPAAAALRAPKKRHPRAGPPDRACNGEGDDRPDSGGPMTPRRPHPRCAARAASPARSSSAPSSPPAPANPASTASSSPTPPTPRARRRAAPAPAPPRRPTHRLGRPRPNASSPPLHHRPPHPYPRLDPHHHPPRARPGSRPMNRPTPRTSRAYSLSPPPRRRRSPRLIAGRLDGDAPAPATLQYALYPAPTDAAPLWIGPRLRLDLDADGRFEHPIEIPPDVLTHPTLWLGVLADGEPFGERLRLGAVPYALMCSELACRRKRPLRPRRRRPHPRPDRVALSGDAAHPR